MVSENTAASAVKTHALLAPWLCHTKVLSLSLTHTLFQSMNATATTGAGIQPHLAPYVRCPILNYCIDALFISLSFSGKQSSYCRISSRAVSCWGSVSRRLALCSLIGMHPYESISFAATYVHTITHIQMLFNSRGADKCRHFIIEEERDASGMKGQYIIAGENSRHCSLEELINYYTHNPVGPFNETLTVPCVQVWFCPHMLIHRHPLYLPFTII